MKIFLKGRVVTYATEKFLDFFGLKVEEVVSSDLKSVGFEIVGKTPKRIFLMRGNKYAWVYYKEE